MTWALTALEKWKLQCQSKPEGILRRQQESILSAYPIVVIFEGGEAVAAQVKT